MRIERSNYNPHIHGEVFPQTIFETAFVAHWRITTSTFSRRVQNIYMLMILSQEETLIQHFLSIQYIWSKSIR